jgi:16S rRNA (guanine527-N7)-methyltransferase
MAANVLSLECPPERQEQLRAFRDLLMRWNLRFNLTAIEEPEEVDRRLIGDALRMLSALDAAIANRATVRLIDVGSGGVVLKIVRPEIELTMLEATRKKVRFLEAAIEELDLDKTRAIHGRAEELAHRPEHRERFDVVTARAVASLPALLEFCMPFVRIGGRGLFPKGADIAAELEEGLRAAPFVGARIEKADPLPTGPGEGVTRLVEVAKIENTPGRFPRRPGIPAKEPLGRIEG